MDNDIYTKSILSVSPSGIPSVIVQRWKVVNGFKGMLNC